jgi:hypothetical protein
VRSEKHIGAEYVTDETIRHVIEEFFLLRGRIISNYAQVEFLAAHMLRLLLQKFPVDIKAIRPVAYKIDTRISELRRISDFISELLPYRIDLLQYLENIETFSDTRHFMAHGYVDVNKHPNGYLFRMQLYKFPKGKEPELHKREFMLDDLRTRSDHLTIYTQTTIQFIRRIYLDLALEE